MGLRNGEYAQYLLLNEFDLSNQRIHVIRRLGTEDEGDPGDAGDAGYVFEIRIGNATYALKMFKFYRSDVCYSRLRGFHKTLRYDRFLVECRANAKLISEKKNGVYTPFCHGWIEVPKVVEDYVAKKFRIFDFLWDRPPQSQDQVRGILFDYINGKNISGVKLGSDIVNALRNHVKQIHESSIVHGDIMASNILVTEEGRPYLIDFSSSITLPHPSFRSQNLENFRKRQERDLEDLEVGITFLSHDYSLVNMSILEGSTIDEVIRVHAPVKRRWLQQSER